MGLIPDTLGALRKNAWIFLLPFAAFSVNFLMSYMMFSAAQADAMLPFLTPNPALDLRGALALYIHQLMDFVPFPYTQIYTDIFILPLMPALVMYRATGRTVDKYTANGVWAAAGPALTISLALTLATYALSFYLKSQGKTEADLPPAVFFAASVIQMTYLIALTSLLAGGVIAGASRAMEGAAVTREEFFTVAAGSFKRMFALNILILAVVMAATLMRGAAIAAGAVANAIVVLFFAAPFFIVLGGMGLLDGLNSAVTLIIRHPVRYIAFFAIMGFAFFAPGVIEHGSMAYTFPVSGAEMLTAYLTTTAAILLSCIGLLAFVRIFRAEFGASISEEHE